MAYPVAIMGGGQRHEAEWEGLRLVIEQHPDHYQAFVYAPAKCEVLYTCARLRRDGAEFSALEFAAATRFGSDHTFSLKTLAKTIVWRSVKAAGTIS
jgi:hypothetical protein